MNHTRNYGIDLLRLVFMFLVCMLHTLGQGGIITTCQPGTAAYQVFWFLEIIAYGATDGFAIISGYTAAEKPPKFNRLAELWFQAFFYSFVLTMLFTVVGLNPSFRKKDLIGYALPVIYRKFWYFTAYFALFFATPILNRFIAVVDERAAKKSVLILIILFSIVGRWTDAFTLNGGYSALWLMVLYCMGGMAKKGNLFERKKAVTLILIWAVCIILTWAERIYGRTLLTHYTSPTIVMSALVMVILFSRLRLKGTIISKLAPLAFGIYLFQLSPVIWSRYLQNAFSFVAQENLVVGVVYVFVFAAVIFAAGLVVEFVRSKLARLVRIPELCKKIADGANWMLEKASFLLK